MRKVRIPLCLIACLFSLSFCSQKKNDLISNNANFNNLTNTLTVDYKNHPDTSLLQIKAFSNIKQSGYGLLLNIENAYTKSDLEALKLKFKMMDINAIHTYDISLKDTLQLKTQVAMKGAKFIWLLGNSNNDWKSKPVGQIISNFQKTEEDKVLVVLD